MSPSCSSWVLTSRSPWGDGVSLDLTVPEQLAQLLRGAGVRAAADPADVNTPGVWVTLDQALPLTVGDDWDHQLVLYLVVPEAPYSMALKGLQELYQDVAAAGVTPDGPVQPWALVLPGSPAQLPALRVPVTYTT